MAFTVRVRLTAWYVALLMASLVAFAVVFSYSLYHVFMSRIDNQISSVANMMVHTVVNPSGQILIPGDFDIILERFFGIRTAGNYIQVLDYHGDVVARSSNLAAMSLRLGKETYAAALRGETTFEVMRDVGPFPVRVVTKPIIIKDKGHVAIVQVASSLDVVEEVFNRLAFIFVFGTVGAVVIASGVGWFLARKALKPVSEITATARRIGAESLDERISVKGPRDEIWLLASTINEMVARLEKSFKQIKQFTADASHELKTPLTVMKGEMEVALRAANDPAHMAEVLKSSLEEIDRMSHMVRNLLDLAKLDAEKGAAPKAPVSVDAVVVERVEHFRRLAASASVGLRLSKVAPAVVTGDSVRVGQLVFNLIDNAIKYTPAGGRVEVRLETDATNAVLTVSDTGIGISREDLPYVFDRFYRVDKARSRDAGGAGLGLSICKEIVDSMNGAIEAKSEPGAGTSFTVRLPLADAAGAAEGVAGGHKRR